MSRNIFGWSLPPGCTMNDIERAFGESPLFDEIFKQNNLNEEEKKVWSQIYDLDEELFNLLIRAMEWSHKTGYDACMSDKAEAEFYEEMAREYSEDKLIQLARKKDEAELNLKTIILKLVEYGNGR